jgi:hypothetical protein
MVHERNGRLDVVIPGTVMLLGSPLLGHGSWGRLPDALEEIDPSVDVFDASVADDDVPPFGQRYLTSVVLAAASTRPRTPLALVGHSAAGPLLPGVGRALRDAGHRVGGYIFMDAGLPGPGRPNRLDLLRRESESRFAELQTLLDAAGRFPDWTLPGIVTRPRDRSFFEEPLPTSDDWPDAPCGYLRTSSAYEIPARQARARRWPVVESSTDHHLPWLADARGVAMQLAELVDRL